jgi:hypothetical protein
VEVQPSRKGPPRIISNSGARDVLDLGCEDDKAGGGAGNNCQLIRISSETGEERNSDNIAKVSTASGTGTTSVRSASSAASPDILSDKDYVRISSGSSISGSPAASSGLPEGSPNSSTISGEKVSLPSPTVIQLDSVAASPELSAEAPISDPLSFSWLERKVLLHSPVAEAVIYQLKRAHSDEARLRVVDNIETWNEYFNSGNRIALDLDILQLLTKHRYRHLDDEGNAVEQRLLESRNDANFWRSAKEKLAEYSRFAEQHGKNLLIQLEAAEP